MADQKKPDPNVDPNADPNQDPDNKPLTRAEVQEMIAAGVNGGMKSWAPRITKGLATADDLTAIKSALEALKPKADPAGGAAPGSAGQPGQAPQNLEAIKLREEVESIKKDLLRTREEKEAQEQKMRQDEEERTLFDAIRACDVPVEMVEAVGSLLLTRRKVLHRNDDGTIMFRVQRKDYTEDLPVKDGVKEFLKTDEGKVYLPPRNVGGSGERGAGKVKGGSQGIDMSIGKAMELAITGSGTPEE
jgi:hypothetical protein